MSIPIGYRFTHETYGSGHVRSYNHGVPGKQYVCVFRQPCGKWLTKYMSGKEIRQRQIAALRQAFKARKQDLSPPTEHELRLMRDLDLTLTEVRDATN